MLGLGLALWMEGLVAPFLPFDAEQGDEVQSGAGRRVSRGLSRDGRRERVTDAGRTPLCIGRAMKIKTTFAPSWRDLPGVVNRCMSSGQDPS